MWFARLFAGKQEPPRLSAIYLSVSAGEVMRSVSSVTALTGKGLSGDRYAAQKGFYKSVDSCEVTLISQADINRASKRGPEKVAQILAAGGHRRNLVISGLSIRELAGQQFEIGEATFHYQKPRPPCAYLDRVSGKGTSKALGKHSGVCIKVIEGGLLSVGDPVRIIQL